MKKRTGLAPSGRVLIKATLQALLILVVAVLVSQLIVIPLFQDRVMRSLQQWEVEYLAGGTIDLLAAEIDSLPADDRVAYMEDRSHDFGFAISLIETGQLDLDPESVDRLRHHEVVGDPRTYSAYLMLEDGSRVLAFDRIRQPAAHWPDEAQLRHMGTLAVLERLLERRQEEFRNTAIRTAAGSFDYPVALTSPASSGLTGEQIAELEAGGIVIVGTDDSDTAEYPAEWVYKMFGDAVLVLGPFSPPTLKRFYPAIVGYYVVLGLMVLVPMGLWLAPTWRSMNRLFRAASAFGQGDFSARASQVRGSKSNHLTDVFNKMAEKIQGLIESHKTLVNSVSHELRTPISRIEFNIELARNSTDIAERNTHLDRIEESIDALNTMVSEMLQFARFDREKPSFSFQSVSMGEWLQSERKNWLAESAGVEIRIVVPPEPTPVSLERYYMSRAVGNLVRNATRFAESIIVVTARRETGAFVISVEDDGPGVDFSERTRIFEPFVRHDRSRSRESGGVGLGLAIVKQIVLWHSGEVWVEESPLGGAKFVVRWPESGGTQAP